MQFHAEFTPKDFRQKLSLADKIMLIGSCFTEQIGQKLADVKFRTMQNPHGILFNPASIFSAIESYVNCKSYSENDLFYHNEMWHSWDHHSRFSNTERNASLTLINNNISAAYEYLKYTSWLIITLGSAWVYKRMDTDSIVANCHKIPNDKFNRMLMQPGEVRRTLDDIIHSAKQLNKDLKIIFTISPVRHLREGFIENNRSKATLINAVHEVVNEEDVFYFPSYELIIDDLRDYRFYAEDLVHPNHAATNYVWEKFVAACVDEPSKIFMKDLQQLRNAVHHKAFNPSSEQHKKFRESMLNKVRELESALPYLDFSFEKNFFQSEC